MRLFPGILLTILSTVSFAADSGSKNRDGTEAFRHGNFEQAAQAFAEAEQAAPDDLRIVFNHGAALTAAGRFDEAIDALRKSALSRNADLAAKSSALLGEIALARVKSLTESDPAKRDEILEHLQTAQRHYMDSRLARPDHPETAAALEQIRSWRQRIEAEWAEADRAEKRQAELPDRLQWLENWQRDVGSSIAGQLEEPDTPKKFQEYFEAAKDQHALSGEIGLLQDEFHKRLGQTPVDAEDRPLLEANLKELGLLREETATVGQRLDALQEKEALDHVDAILRRLNRLRIHFSPCEVIVQEAERKQTMLCELNLRTETNPPDDLPRQANEEQTIGDWMPLAVSRAERWLEQDKGTTASTDQPGEAEQLEAYRETMRRAVQYGPEIQGLAETASLDLLERMLDEARPKQQRALELLRKILEPLQNQQDQDQQDQDQQDQDQQDQNQQGQDQQNREGRDEEPKDQDKQNSANDPQTKDSEKDEKKSADSKSSETGDKREEREKAESKLRQVKRRQQEAQEQRERIRALLMQSEPVEKDW